VPGRPATTRSGSPSWRSRTGSCGGRTRSCGKRARISRRRSSTEGGTYSRINSTITETVEGSRTVEALQLESLRQGHTDDDLGVSGQAERYTLTLRNLLFTTLDYALQGPLIGIVLLGTWGYAHGLVTLGQITAAALYSQQMYGPIDHMIQILDRLQT